MDRIAVSESSQKPNVFRGTGVPYLDRFAMRSSAEWVYAIRRTDYASHSPRALGVRAL